jgi:hypothetical protein
MIEELPRLLSWENDASTRKAIYNVYVNRASSRLGHALRHIVEDDPVTGNMLLTELQALSDESFMRLITSPELFSQVSQGIPKDSKCLSDFLAFSIEAELIKVGKIGTSSGVWTAIGDRYYPKGPVDADFEEREGEISVWQVNNPFRAPSICDRIVVDYSSPFAKHSLDVKSRPSWSDIDRVRRVLGKLEEGFVMIENISDAAFDNVNRFVRVVALGTDSSVGNAFCSSSSKNQIGRMDLTNADIDKVDSANVADALLHESIHSLLYTVELDEPFILDREAVEDTRIKSPWTGAELPVHSFLHACLVWFGLWQFWSLALYDSRFSMDRAQRQFQGAEVGFTKGRLVERLNGLKPVIAPEICLTIQEVQEAVLAKKNPPRKPPETTRVGEVV